MLRGEEAKRDKFPESLASSTTLLFACMGADELRYVLPVAAALRSEGVSVEVYPEPSKLKKQFDYAGKKSIPFLSINGGNEVEAGAIQLKNLTTGEQKSFAKADIYGMMEFMNIQEEEP